MLVRVSMFAPSARQTVKCESTPISVTSRVQYIISVSIKSNQLALTTLASKVLKRYTSLVNWALDPRDLSTGRNGVATEVHVSRPDTSRKGMPMNEVGDLGTNPVVSTDSGNFTFVEPFQ